MQRVLAIIVVVLAVASYATDPVIRQIKVQEITVQEATDTTLSRGETVVIFGDDSAAEMRVGDGENAGGRVVSDPAALRATQTRVLRDDEYALVPAGVASWTNGVWQLLPERQHATGDYGRTGCVQVASLYPIASVSYNVATQRNVQITLTPRKMGADTTNAWITATETEQILTGDVLFPFGAAISNITVHAWTEPEFVGAVLDARHNKLLVQSGWNQLEDNEPVNKETFLAVLEDRYGADWWRYIAGGAIRLDSNPLWLAPTLRQVARENEMQWIYRTPLQTDRTIMAGYFGSASDTNQAFRILASDLTSDPVRIWISATIDFSEAPIIQHRASMLDGVWTNCVTTTDWPETETITVDEQSRTAWLLTTPRTGTIGFYRVYGQTDGDAIVSDYIEFAVGDLRNTGTITAGQGFRVASPSGGTNYVDGVTTNITTGGVTLHFVGGIFVGATE